MVLEVVIVKITDNDIPGKRREIYNYYKNIFVRRGNKILSTLPNNINYAQHVDTDIMNMIMKEIHFSPNLDLYIGTQENKSNLVWNTDNRGLDYMTSFIINSFRIKVLNKYYKDEYRNTKIQQQKEKEEADKQWAKDKEEELKKKKDEKQKDSAVNKEILWKHYFGNKFRVLCPCCEIHEITVGTSHKSHKIPKVATGEETLENLIPLCQQCNLSMGTMLYDDFKNSLLKEKIELGNKIDKLCEYQFTKERIESILKLQSINVKHFEDFYNTFIE